MNGYPEWLLGVVLATRLFITGNAGAADFYVDPVNGSATGNGSAANPWLSLQQVLDDNLVESLGWASLPPDDSSELVEKNVGAPVKSGDTLWLHAGDYGALNLTGYYNPEMITIQAVDGEEARFSSVLVRASANWTLRGLSVSPAFGDPYEPTTMIDIDSHDWQGPVHDIVIDGCSLQSVGDTGSWSLDDWNSLPANGVNADGTRITISNNYLKNVNFGISVGASHSTVAGNTVENFAGDGMRGLGDYTVFAYNLVKNCYDVNENHDDGFQSWSVGDDGVGTGTVRGIVLRGNTIINYEDPNQPFRGTLQGIGCFDGMFDDWVVENNVIYTDHWHGISLYGARNCRIVNNTVLDPNDEDPGPPWIMINDHKNGTPPKNCVVANNLTTSVSGVDTPENFGNIIIEDPSVLFVDVSNFDFHLLPQSVAVDAGLPEYAPEKDLDQIPRPQGNSVDVGAYEWHEAAVEPELDTDLRIEDVDVVDNADDTGTSGSDQSGCACAVWGENPAPSIFQLLL